MNARRRLVVAGFGNALRGDDGAGWLVARALADERGVGADPAGEHDALILSGHQPLPEWVPAIAAADVAYFVDAEAGIDRVGVRRLGAPDHAAPPMAPPAAAGLMDGHAL